MSKIIINNIIMISILSVFLTGCSNMSFKVDMDNYDYKKEATEENYYPVDNNKIIIKSDNTDIIIKKDDVNEIKINLQKYVGGIKEKEVDEIFENIKSEYDNGKITISCPKMKSISFISINNKAEIVVPNHINDVEIESDIGDITSTGDYEKVKVENDIGDIHLNGIYNTLNLTNDTGDIYLNGEAKVCDIESDIGDINLDLDKVQDDYKYSIKSDVGSLDINLPKQSCIQLKGESKKHAQVDSSIQVGNQGTEFDLDTSISDIEISGI